VRYAKRGRLRFSSHRDFQRALERALRRAGVPMAYSAGFHPHPKISFANAAPTGTASEAEYVELGLAARCDPEALRVALDASLPTGLDVLQVVEAGPGALADRLAASEWLVALPGVARADAAAAVTRFLAQERVDVQRLTKNGMRTLDARGPVLSLSVAESQAEPAAVADAEAVPVLRLVVRHVTPTVRPAEVLEGLATVAGLIMAEPARAQRLAQGPLLDGEVVDPLA
jgi:radical SAM-linked protein